MRKNLPQTKEGRKRAQHVRKTEHAAVRRLEPLDSSLAENLSSECSNVDLEDMRSNYLLRVKLASEYYLSSHLYHYLLLISRLLYLMTDLVERF